MSVARIKTFYDNVIEAFVTTYQPDGYDSVHSTLNGEPVDSNSEKKYQEKISRLSSEDDLQDPALYQEQDNREEQLKIRRFKYISHPLTMVFTFLGFPTRMLDGENPSLSNLAKNFIGWQSNASGMKKATNILFAPLSFAFNLIMIVPKLALNSLRLVTEFLPLLGVKVLERLAASAREVIDRQQTYANSKNDLKKYYNARVLRGAQVGYALESIGVYLLKTLHFIGRSITAPITNINFAWVEGQRLAGEGVAGKLLGGALAGMSGLITLAIYIIALPLAVKFAATTIVPWVMTKLPIAATNAATTVFNTVTNFLAPYTQTFGAAIGSVINAVAGSLVQAIHISPIYAGVSALVAAAVVTLGNAIVELTTRFFNWWYRDKPSLNVVANEAKDVLDLTSTDLKVLHGCQNGNKAAQVKLPERRNSRSMLGPDITAAVVIADPVESLASNSIELLTSSRSGAFEPGIRLRESGCSNAKSNDLDANNDHDGLTP